MDIIPFEKLVWDTCRYAGALHYTVDEVVHDISGYRCLSSRASAAFLRYEPSTLKEAEGDGKSGASSAPMA